MFVVYTTGSYSDSAGVEVIRRHVADYITHRDGSVASDYSNVFLSNGASDAIRVRTTAATSRLSSLYVQPCTDRLASGPLGFNSRFSLALYHNSLSLRFAPDLIASLPYRALPSFQKGCFAEKGRNEVTKGEVKTETWLFSCSKLTTDLSFTDRVIKR